MKVVTNMVYECESLPGSIPFNQHVTIHCNVTTTSKSMSVSPEHLMRILKSNIERDSQQVFYLLIAIKLLLEDPHNDRVLDLLTKCIDGCIPEEIDLTKIADHLEKELKGLYA